ESKIELLESTDPEGVIARYIEKRGEGLHHLALAVSDIEQALSNLRGKGVPIIDEKPRNGVEETRIAFLHPKVAGVLIELVEPKK
ncbi:MAG: VOC family protein, partial [Dehalococcoidales bacterium]|nr:VOC family protein [Dehalococcoidales bacterium]